MDRTQDRLLIAGLQRGDQAAVRRLAELYGPRIHQLALRHMKNREDAEEVTQDVLMKVYRKIGAFRGDSALSSWIYRITFNTAMSRLRAAPWRARGRAGARSRAGGARRVRRRHAANDRRSCGLVAACPTRSCCASSCAKAVEAAVRELPEIYREPVILRDFEGLTTEEASTRLKVKDQTLKSRLHRGRLMLRETLQAFASGLTLHRPTPAYS